ncbi:lantibiotic dehydratase [Geothrix sp. PMB-07]|uniref:lantibiotic dehydratase n=1 Tax=Geothrix sp. PMB-07 TaxID=3068640 RepID=UPI0027416DA5|nr:lantibiotic dehydratase [Geothrix sp. PMB-07]WLT30242.1 lantibiotic dehydratase [Geothrix sp. PMB-07]
MREALALASPDLATRIDAWLDGSLDRTAAQNMERALLKYLSRLSSRSTPFGLFAGVSTGRWGSVSSLAVGSWRASRKSVRLDWGVLEELVARLEQEPEVRSARTYRPNTSAYARGGWYRYMERRQQAGAQARTYHLEAVEATAHLDSVLHQAKEGAHLDDLCTGLVRQVGADQAEARDFLEQVIASQLLCGDLAPALTHPDPLAGLIAILQSRPETAIQATPLVALNHTLEAIQVAPLGAHPEGYLDLIPPLVAAGLPPGMRDVLQVDLFRPGPGLALSAGVRRALEEGAETLRRLTPAPLEGPLDRFRAAFLERYEARWMPLLEVLDEESGIGFDGGTPMESPLLEGLAFPGFAGPRQLTERDRALLARLPKWQGSQAWELDDADLEALANPRPQPFPHSFAALAVLGADSVTALDQGDFHFWMEHHSGPTAARWLGRFASGDADLKASLCQHLLKEEALRPEVVFAEVVHVPEGRMGNVLARPSLREYEIPFLAAPGVAPGKTIWPADLQVAVRGDRIHLASASLRREVVPRLSSAHNFAHGPAVYRFLAHLQDQDGRSGGWSWGALDELSFLPRVTRGRHVMCKARWRIEKAELAQALAASGQNAWVAFQRLREQRGLPRFVVLADADNSLLVDLDQAVWVEALHHLVSGRSAFTLTECFPDPDQALVTAPEGGFAHELVIPFEATEPALPQAAPLALLGAPTSLRVHAPGSEWLYLKIYCGPTSADRLLVELETFLHETGKEAIWDRWHFVRYRDPDHHVRLRFHGRPLCLTTELLPRLARHLDEGLGQGLLWKWQVDTFMPELERYGGEVGFSLAEAWFHEDSGRVLDRLVAGVSLEARWKAGLAEVDAIWGSLGLDLKARRDLAQASREAFRKEFGDAGEGAVRIGAAFRPRRKELESLIPSSEAPNRAGLGRIREAFDQGKLKVDLPSLAGSLAHMHLNRLLRRDHRETEWVLMEFLARLYESRLARRDR